MNVLDEMSAKYLWWKTGDDRPHMTRRVLAQVMNMGDWDDVLRVIDEVGEAPLRDVLSHAEAGWLTPRSWAFWHYRLGVVPPGEAVPPLPRRRFK